MAAHGAETTGDGTEEGGEIQEEVPLGLSPEEWTGIHHQHKAEGFLTEAWTYNPTGSIEGNTSIFGSAKAHGVPEGPAALACYAKKLGLFLGGEVHDPVCGSSR